MTPTVVREVRSTDAQPVAELLNRIIAAGGSTVIQGPLSADDEREYIDGFPERGVFNVVEAGSSGELAGFQSLEPFAAYSRAFDHVGIIGTYVDSGMRRAGLGTLLAQATFQGALELGYRKIFTYVRADNSAALGYYASLGFRTVGIAEGQVRDGDAFIDEVVIERHL